MQANFRFMRDGLRTKFCELHISQLCELDNSQFCELDNLQFCAQLRVVSTIKAVNVKLEHLGKIAVEHRCRDGTVVID